jgi:hypothetical protein
LLPDFRDENIQGWNRDVNVFKGMGEAQATSQSVLVPTALQVGFLYPTLWGKSYRDVNPVLLIEKFRMISPSFCIFDIF